MSAASKFELDVPQGTRGDDRAGVSKPPASSSIHSAATIRPLTFIVRCPDGSWSKWGSRRCKLDLGHAGKHVYEIVTRDGTEVRLGR